MRSVFFFVKPTAVHHTYSDNSVSQKYDMQGAPIYNTVLQHFSCNMVDAIRTTPQVLSFSAVFNGAPRVWAEMFLFWAQNSDETAT